MANSLLMIDPREIRFTHSRVRPFFSGCGRSLESTIESIINKEITIEDLPMITIIKNGNFYFSLNNRRLYVFKFLRDNGFLEARDNLIQVRTKAALPRELERYTIDRCSLSAKIMISKEVSSIESAVSSIVLDENDNNNNTIAITSSVSNLTIIKEESNTQLTINHSDPSSIPITTKTSNTIKSSHKTPKPLPTSILTHIKSLIKLIEKKKYKQVSSQINEWLADGLIIDDQLDRLIDMLSSSGSTENNSSGNSTNSMRLLLQL